MKEAYKFMLIKETGKSNNRWLESCDDILMSSYSEDLPTKHSLVKKAAVKVDLNANSAKIEKLKEVISFCYLDSIKKWQED